MILANTRSYAVKRLAYSCNITFQTMLYACRSRRYVVQMFIIYRPTALYMKRAAADLGNGQFFSYVVSKYRGGSLHTTPTSAYFRLCFYLRPSEQSFDERPLLPHQL